MSTPIFDQLLAEFQRSRPGFKVEAPLPKRPKLRGIRPAGVILDEVTLQNEALDNAVYSAMNAKEAEDTYFAAKSAWLKNEQAEADAQASAERVRAFVQGWQLGIIPRPVTLLKEAS
jgi:hypothetical protein